MTQVSFLTAGDTGLVVDFGNAVDLSRSAKVLALAQRLNASGLAGILEAVPTTRSLSIYYEPLLVSGEALKAEVSSLLDDLQNVTLPGRAWELPVCYDPEIAPDLNEVAERCGLTPQQVIDRHCGETYHVYMLGFLPGLAYLGDLHPSLHLPRRLSPRPSVPAGSLGIGGAMTCIYPFDTPCGWHIIGRCPVALWDTRLDSGALLSPGDKVNFKAISLREFERGEVWTVDPSPMLAPAV